MTTVNATCTPVMRTGSRGYRISLAEVKAITGRLFEHALFVAVALAAATMTGALFYAVM